MKKILSFLVPVTLVLFWVSAPASAEVMHYVKCKLEDGKAIEDAQTWLDGWRKLKTEKGIDYHIRLLLPHADNDLVAGEFFIEGRSSTLASHAAAYEWWYTDAEAEESGTQLNAAAACDAGVIYRTTD